MERAAAPDCACAAQDQPLPLVLQALKHRADGLFHAQSFAEAMGLYDHCLKHLAFAPERAGAQQLLDRGLFFRVLGNVSMCLIQLGSHREALAYCEFIIAMEPRTFKAYHRAGVCLDRLGHREEAIRVLRLGKEHVSAHGGPQLIAEYFSLLNRLIKEHNENVDAQSRSLQSFLGPPPPKPEPDPERFSFAAAALTAATATLLLAPLLVAVFFALRGGARPGR